MDQEVMQQGPKMTIEQQLKISKPFTNQEIKEAMFSIPNTKSPSPDGFSNGFFKKCWNNIGPRVTQTYKSFSEVARC